jgi:hypothetical protein
MPADLLDYKNVKSTLTGLAEKLAELGRHL